MAALTKFLRRPAMAPVASRYLASRLLRSSTTLRQTEAEEKMTSKLKEIFATEQVRVEDNSGGCGAQYEVHIVSEKFEGLSRLKQNRLVTQALKDEIADMHAIRVFTEAPPK
eukprot:TRINITY_DN7941_c0_g1_i1.p1 TRINITY_DN7941_c0_g1~~TRINITY_DN7941_c0_g1_i1.p1  ORF type:complete len:112 (+),score=6.54 TRINITY_DN7941_c0_g1_i1:59-394(+)